jgi:hypothetical protein
MGLEIMYVYVERYILGQRSVGIGITASPGRAEREDSGDLHQP